MQLLDATLAIALTLAALATIVTIIMEAGLRAARMRKKNLVEVMKLLNKEFNNEPLKLDPEQRWKFISNVIRNPAKATADNLTELLNELLKKPDKKPDKTKRLRILFNWFSNAMKKLRRKSDNAEDQRKEHNHKRKIESTEYCCISMWKGGEKSPTSSQQPDLIPIPERQHDYRRRVGITHRFGQPRCLHHRRTPQIFVDVRVGIDLQRHAVKDHVGGSSFEQ